MLGLSFEILFEVLLNFEMRSILVRMDYIIQHIFNQLVCYARTALVTRRYVLLIWF